MYTFSYFVNFACNPIIEVVDFKDKRKRTIKNRFFFFRNNRRVKRITSYLQPRAIFFDKRDVLL